MSVFKKYDWAPVPGESPEEYIERVGGWTGANMEMRKVLENEFGIPKSESKHFVLRSRAFQERFFREHLEEMHGRGGSRYGAINYVRRKSDLSEDEIAALVDSIGEWKK